MSKMSEEGLGSILNQYWEERKQAGIVGTKHAAAHRKAKELIHSYTQEKCREARTDELSNIPEAEAGKAALHSLKVEVHIDERLEWLKAQLNKSKSPVERKSTETRSTEYGKWDGAQADNREQVKYEETQLNKSKGD